MKAGIMQPYFFPYIGYFQLIKAVDTFVMYDLVAFRKRSWITRNRILDKGKNQPIYIHMPVEGKSSFKTINQVQLVQESKWKKNLLNLVYYNYKRAPFFSETYSLIEDCLNFQANTINGFNMYSVSKICDVLDIKTPILTSHSSFTGIEEKLPKIVANVSEMKSKRVLEICKVLGVATYVNPIGGTELYNKAYFIKNKLDLEFVQTQPFSYRQFNDDYIPYLSIIDVLMHNNKQNTKQLINAYKLI